MRIAVALRTCGAVFNHWGHPHRLGSDDKSTVILTCLHSLLSAITASGHEVVFSIHDDSSSENLIRCMGELCQQFNVTGDLIESGKHNNFKTQYEWIKQQDYDYAYCVEDDYLHQIAALSEMVDICEHMRNFFPAEYSVFPFNIPHRYSHPNLLYTSYIIKGATRYWRSSLHSTHTFFVSSATFNEYDHVMRSQAYQWPDISAVEDNNINTIWQEQKVRLLCPLDSLAWHIADESQEDTLGNWKQHWDENLTEEWLI